MLLAVVQFVLLSLSVVIMFISLDSYSDQVSKRGSHGSGEAVPNP